MTKKHCIHITQTDMYYKPTYTQNNVLDIGDIIEATFDGFDDMSDKVVVVKERPHENRYGSICEDCPFKVIEHNRWGSSVGCTARRKTGKGMRSICQKGIGRRTFFEFEDLNNVLEDL